MISTHVHRQLTSHLYQLQKPHMSNTPSGRSLGKDLDAEILSAPLLPLIQSSSDSRLLGLFNQQIYGMSWLDNHGYLWVIARKSLLVNGPIEIK